MPFITIVYFMYCHAMQPDSAILLPHYEAVLHGKWKTDLCHMGLKSFTHAQAIPACTY